MQLDLKGLTFNFVIINFLEAVAEVIFYLECDDFPNTWQVQLQGETKLKRHGCSPGKLLLEVTSPNV